MNNRLFFLLLLVSMSIFSMEDAQKMTILRKWEDAKPFAGRIVAFKTPWRDISYRVMNYAIVFNESKEGYGYITEVGGENITTYPENTGSFLNPLMYTTSGCIFYAPLTSLELAHDPLALRLANLFELERIKGLIEKKQATFKLYNVNENEVIKNEIKARSNNP